MRLVLPCIASAIAAALVIACDPVHQSSVDALPGEAQGVHPGPLHRPGQPCGLCHDGTIGNPPQFTVAGTIYVDAAGAQPADGAIVSLLPADGRAAYRATTNAAGNFYVTPNEFTPTYPLKVSVSYGGTNVDMTALVGRNGSCASCHSDPVGAASAGRIYIPAGGVTP